MTSDSIRPPEKRYNYSNAITGLVTLVKSEDVRGLFRGLGTNTVSDAVLTLTAAESGTSQTRAVLMNVSASM